VLRVCELANARSFIEEDDLDKLEGEDLTKRLEYDLATCIKKKGKKYPNIAKIDIKSIEATDKNKYLALLLKVLKMSDTKARKVIEKDVTKML
jgi:hypothetical protein